jgi:hypothetical protein
LYKKNLRNTENNLKKWSKRASLKTQRRKMRMNMKRKKEGNSNRS